MNLILEKDLWIVSLAHLLLSIFKKNVYHVIFLLTDQIILPDGIRFLRYLTIFVLQLVLNLSAKLNLPLQDPEDKYWS